MDGITWSHDGTLIASGSEAGEAFLWDADSYEMVGRIKVGSTINSLDFTQDDSKLVVAGNIQTPDSVTGETHYGGFAKLIDVKAQQAIQEYAGHTASIKSVRISPDEKHVATGSFDSTARIFDLKSGKLLHTFREPLRIEAVAFTADGQYLACGGASAQNQLLPHERLRTGLRTSRHLVPSTWTFRGTDACWLRRTKTAGCYRSL